MVITFLGLAAGVLTTGSWLPQVIRILRTRSATDLSWLYLAAFGVGTCAWLTYGAMRSDQPIVVTNGATFVLVATLCGAKLWTGAASSSRTAHTFSPVMGTVDAVLFDMDGTLVDSDAVVRRSWAVWAAQRGIDSADILRVSPGKPSAQAMAELAPHLSSFDIGKDAAELLRREVSDLDGVTAAPGAPELVRQVQLSGVRWGVVTSASRELARVRLTACGLPVPAVLVTCEDVELGKPHPEGYLRAAALLGTEPSRCLVIEDSQAGVLAGLAAGMTVVGTGPRPIGSGVSGQAVVAHRWVSDLTKFRALAVTHADGTPALRMI